MAAVYFVGALRALWRRKLLEGGAKEGYRLTQSGFNAARARLEAYWTKMRSGNSPFYATLAHRAGLARKCW